MPAFKGTKALPGTGNADARTWDEIASNSLIQARLNDTSRRKYLEKRYGKEAIDQNVGFLRSEGSSARKTADDKRKAKKYAKGGSVSSASKRADGCATKGKTKGRFV